MDKRSVANLTTLAIIITATLCGCASKQNSGLQSSERFGPGQVSPEAVNSMTISFAEDHVNSLMEVVDVLMADAENPQVRSRLNTFATANVEASLGLATGPNPLVALIDTLVMLSLQKEALRRSAIDTTLTEQQLRDPESYDLSDERVAQLLTREQRLMHQVFVDGEEQLRALASAVLWPEQFQELDDLTAEWWRRNPARRLVTHTRLQDFANYRTTTVQTVSSGPRNLLGLIYLDPLASMDPTTREIAQARMLADRINMQIQRLPFITTLNARGLMYEALAIPEIASVGTALNETQASVSRFVTMAEGLPTDIATERDAAITQLQNAVSAETEAAINQLADRFATEREDAIAGIDAAASSQRDAILAAIDERNEPFNATLANLDTTLESATTLSDSVKTAVESIDTLTTKIDQRNKARDPQPEPTSIADYQRLVESATVGVEGIERSLTTIERLLAPNDDDAGTSAASRNLTVATQGMREVVDHAFVRGIQLAGIVFLFWILAASTTRIIASKLIAKKT